MKFSEYPINILLVSLFIVALISFGSLLAVDYRYNESIMSDESLDLSGLEAQIQRVNTDAERWEESFRSDNLFVSLGSIVLFSVWGVIKLIWSSIFSLFNVILQGATTALGLPAIVTGTIMAILIIGLIFAAWRVIKAGE